MHVVPLQAGVNREGPALLELLLNSYIAYLEVATANTLAAAGALSILDGACVSM